ncbi:DUF5074 domain-containing protein [Coprobacter sp.]
MKSNIYFFLLSILLLFTSCRGDEPVPTPRNITVSSGFYLLNEGNKGNNMATLDYFDYTSNIYSLNIYAERNPSVVKELGDVGNDLQIYGNRLYAVVNCSNFIEVTDLKTTKHIGMIQIPSCRYIVFHKDKAYVSSYASADGNDLYAKQGYVAKVDTASLQVESIVAVGSQPEEMVIVDNKLYVANSMCVSTGEMDRTVSVIDLNTFSEIKKIDVAVNLHRMKADRYGYIYVSSRGDYYNGKSDLYMINTRTDKVEGPLSIPVNNMCISGDSLYILAKEFNYITGYAESIYGIIDTRTHKILTRNFISDGTDIRIDMPYGIAVNPVSKEILITDAKDFITPGLVYCFTPKGKKIWEYTTGEIPSNIAFVLETQTTNKEIRDY